jgi:hypothetical protein
MKTGTKRIPIRYYDEGNPRRLYDMVTLDKERYLVRVDDIRSVVEVVEADEEFTSPLPKIKALRLIKRKHDGKGVETAVMAKPVRSNSLLERIALKSVNDVTSMNPPLE